jgi:hypothetical protein
LDERDGTREAEGLGGPETDSDDAGGVTSAPNGGTAKRFGIAFLALAIFGATAFAGWRAYRSVSPGTTNGARSTPAGYYLLFPEEITTIGGRPRLVVETNLPDGTRYELRSEEFGPEGSSQGQGIECCDQLEAGRIVVPVGSGACSNYVGSVGNSTGFTIELRVRPVFDDFPIFGPPRADRTPPAQPDSVLAVLGTHFEKLVGDQVVVDADGTRQLVADHRYEYPEPQCGGDPLPLFGDPECPENPIGERLQGSDLSDTMGHVMGTLSQGRMCEFWWVMLPADVRRAHRWSEFSKEWRDWLLRQDFSDAVSDATWSQEPLTWHMVRTEGNRNFVDVTNHDRVILSLEIDALPDACLSCDPNVVPFWGVVAWQLY